MPAIVAVDIVDRMLRGETAYDRSDVNRRDGHDGRRWCRSEPIDAARWYAGTAIAVDDTVLVTPVESDRLFAIDLLTGQEQFAEKNRVRMHYLAGVRDNRILVAGTNQVRV